MRLPISVDIPDAIDEKPFANVFALLRRIDRRFSPFKKTSELSRIQTGMVPKQAISAEMREVMDACDGLRAQTGGYFSAYFSGRFDPTGYVKGWAVRRASELLEAAGIGTYLINAGGDVLARSNSARVWRIGLQHPIHPGSIAGTVTAGNLAVATSGSYARGQHIIDPVAGRAASGVLSATVVGPDIAIADAFATAVCAMGKGGVGFIEQQPGYELFLVESDLTAHMSSGFAKMQNAQ